MDVAIREATVDDLPQVAGLLVELGRDVAPSATANPSYLILFGGRQRLGHPRPQAWVNDLIVTESMRGQGVGRALLAWAEDLARARGCFRMSLETASRREATHRFYAREGWTDNGKWFVKLLDESWRQIGFGE